MEIMMYWWLVLTFIFLVGELGHPGLFFFLSCGIGSLGAAFIATHYSLILQCSVFLFTTLIILFVLKRWIKKNNHVIATNVHALIGKQAIVLVSLNAFKPGLVKIQGEQWSARSLNETEIEIGQMVEVIAVKGSHVIVKQMKGSL
jgi:membrane protein implicated in regulation of membrane protease activity